MHKCNIFKCVIVLQCLCASRCTGVHVWPMMFDHSVEVEPEGRYVIRNEFPCFRCLTKKYFVFSNNRSMWVHY